LSPWVSHTFSPPLSKRSVFHECRPYSLPRRPTSSLFCFRSPTHGTLDAQGSTASISLPLALLQRLVKLSPCQHTTSAGATSLCFYRLWDLSLPFSSFFLGFRLRFRDRRLNVRLLLGWRLQFPMRRTSLLHTSTQHGVLRKSSLWLCLDALLIKNTRLYRMGCIVLTVALICCATASLTLRFWLQRLNRKADHAIGHEGIEQGTGNMFRYVL